MMGSVGSKRESRPGRGDPPNERSAPGVSARTLVLMLELLLALVSLQYLVAARPARAGIVWLGDCCPPTVLPAPVGALPGTANT